MEVGAVPSLAPWYRLQTSSSAPITCIAETVRRHWPADKLIIPIVVFAVDCSGITLALSREHTTMRWVQFREAQTLLHYDADKTAVWEISELVKSPVLMKSI
jgi:dATP pyrophosphohydrolase